jgi:hypothetical protein
MKRTDKTAKRIRQRNNPDSSRSIRLALRRMAREVKARAESEAQSSTAAAL